MFILANYYSAYKERKGYASFYEKDKDWGSAEDMSIVISFMMKESFSPSEFMTTKDQDEDEIFSRTKIINQLKESIEITGMDESDIIAFCESAIHDYIPMLDVNYYNFAEQMKWIMLYSLGGIEELDMFDISFIPPHIRPFNSKMFKRTWLGIEKRYWKVVAKRNARKMKFYANEYNK